MLRILDANLNRLGEGLRLLEDISRFILNDAALSEQIKTLRHDLLPKDSTLREKLLGSRRAGDDVGAALDVESEGERPDVSGLVSANSRRVEQSLRVLEEITKVPGQDFGLDWEEFKRVRFQIYELEQSMLLQLSRQGKTQKLKGLYLILDTEALQGRDEVSIAKQAIDGGVSSIQFRDKTRSKKELLPMTLELKKVCAESGVVFIINDYLDVALASDADGLHVGQEDLPLLDARRLLPTDKIVGCSASTVDEAVLAQEQGADYVGVGSIYPSPTKPGTRYAGLDTLRQVRDRVTVPIVAIGGISEDNITDVIEAGADAAAVISAVLGDRDVKQACRQLIDNMGVFSK
jgi:thiamine-phosphate pyrophosphorylase